MDQNLKPNGVVIAVDVHWEIRNEMCWMSTSYDDGDFVVFGDPLGVSKDMFHLHDLFHFALAEEMQGWSPVLKLLMWQADKRTGAKRDILVEEAIVLNEWMRGSKNKASIQCCVEMAQSIGHECDAFTMSRAMAKGWRLFRRVSNRLGQHGQAFASFDLLAPNGWRQR